jgi:hypothetical protein
VQAVYLILLKQEESASTWNQKLHCPKWRANTEIEVKSLLLNTGIVCMDVEMRLHRSMQERASIQVRSMPVTDQRHNRGPRSECHTIIVCLGSVRQFSETAR